MAQKLRGLKAKIYGKQRREEKIQMKKTIKMHEEKKSKKEKAPSVPEGAIPAYLMDRCVALAWMTIYFARLSVLIDFEFAV